MPKTRQSDSKEWISPIGQSIDDHIAEQERLDPEYKREAERVGHLFDFAKLVFMRRAELGMSQQELAERMGTSHSVISRIESGRHNFSLTTMRRLAKALDVKLVYGFEVADEGASEPTRNLVVVP